MKSKQKLGSLRAAVHPAWMRVVGGELLPQEADAPELLKRIAANAAIKQALRGVLDGLKQTAVHNLQIRLRVKGGRVERIWIEGGLPVPAALKEMALGQSLSGEQDGWLVLELELDRR